MAVTEVVDELMTKHLCPQDVLLSERKALVPEGPHSSLYGSRSVGSLQIPSVGAAYKGQLKSTLGRTQKPNPSLSPMPKP